MARLAGKVAFIAGGGGGIDAATAERFAEEGARVVVADLNEETGTASAQSAKARASAGGDAAFIKYDVTDRMSVEAAIKQTVSRYGAAAVR